MNNPIQKKVIVFSAPSGAGKSTVVSHLLKKYPFLEFSVSATSRAPRGKERNGVDYYFFSAEQFEEKIRNNEFLEFEEVYHGSYYGTLKSEVERIWNKGHIILFDIDVKGGINIKRIFGKNALAIFIQPPSVQVLKERLIKRGTDSAEAIEKRIGKAREELSYTGSFDRILVNDNLEKTLAEAELLIESFVRQES